MASITSSTSSTSPSDSTTVLPPSPCVMDLQRAPAQHADAGPFHFRHQMGAHLIVESAQDLAALDQRHLAAKRAEHAGEFDSNVAAALHQHAARQGFQMERLVGRDGQLAAGNLRPQRRPRAGGDEDVPGRHHLSVERSRTAFGPSTTARDATI